MADDFSRRSGKCDAAGAASWRRINEVLQTGDQLESTGQQLVPMIQTIEFSEYSFKYPNTERFVLQDVDLTITKGEVLGIVGKTGSGKTSLLRQFGHRYPYSNQMPMINGQPLTAFQTEEIRRHFAEVPQEHTLFSRTIRENLLFGTQTHPKNAYGKRYHSHVSLKTSNGCQKALKH